MHVSWRLQVKDYIQPHLCLSCILVVQPSLPTPTFAPARQHSYTERAHNYEDSGKNRKGSNDYEKYEQRVNVIFCVRPFLETFFPNIDNWSRTLNIRGLFLGKNNGKNDDPFRTPHPVLFEAVLDRIEPSKFVVLFWSHTT